MDILAKHTKQAITKEDCTVVVSNLSETLTESNLIKFFSYCGTLSDYSLKEEVVDDKKERVYEIVFSSMKEAKNALELSDTDLVGRKIKITTKGINLLNEKKKILKRKKEEEEKKENLKVQQVKIVGNDEIEETRTVEENSRAASIRRTVYLGNINSEASVVQLVDFFSCCGPISFVRLAGDGQHPTRFAFVEFFNEEGAIKALSLNGRRLFGRPLKVNKSNNAIVKTHIRLNNKEYRNLQRAIVAIKNKVVSGKKIDKYAYHSDDDEFSRESDRYNRRRKRSYSDEYVNRDRRDYRRNPRRDRRRSSYDDYDKNYDSRSRSRSPRRRKRKRYSRDSYDSYERSRRRRRRYSRSWSRD